MKFSVDNTADVVHHSLIVSYNEFRWIKASSSWLIEIVTEDYDSSSDWPIFHTRLQKQICRSHLNKDLLKKTMKVHLTDLVPTCILFLITIFSSDMYSLRVSEPEEGLHLPR